MAFPRSNVRKSEPINKWTDDDDATVELRYGPMPTFPYQKRFTRHLILISIVVIVFFYSKKEKDHTLATGNISLNQKTMSSPCSQSLSQELQQYPGCIPPICGRGVYDKIITSSEVNALLKIAEKGFSLSKPGGGAAIMDLHSGALSYEDHFINILKSNNASSLFDPTEYAVYKTVRSKIQQAIAAQFLINSKNLYLTHPTFFSQLTAEPARNIHDEYWHIHVDKETYPTFHFTALLYLSTYKVDFEGGRFIFVEADNSSWIVEPTRGRVLIFTSGSENTHRVERVTTGTRRAITIAFTCDFTSAINDPGF